MSRYWELVLAFAASAGVLVLLALAWLAMTAMLAAQDAIEKSNGVGEAKALRLASVVALVVIAVLLVLLVPVAALGFGGGW